MSSENLYIRKRICPGHPNGRIVGNLEGIKIIYCPICGGVRLKRISNKAPFISTIIAMAELCHEYVEKENGGKWTLEEFIKNKARKRGMHPNTVSRALGWICKAGSQYGVSPDGILHKKKIRGMEIKRAYIRLRDEFGDPPILSTIFTCPTCGEEWDVNDIAEGERFMCEECFSWHIDGGEGGIRQVKPPQSSDLYEIKGIVYDESTGLPVKGGKIKIRKRVVGITREGKFLTLPIPPGTYRIDVDCSGYKKRSMMISVPLPEELSIFLTPFDPLMDIAVPAAVMVGAVAILTSPIWLPILMGRQ